MLSVGVPTFWCHQSCALRVESVTNNQVYYKKTLTHGAAMTTPERRSTDAQHKIATLNIN